VNCEEFVQENLKERLDRSVNGSGLSNILSNLGITAEESVELIIKQGNNTIGRHKILLESHNGDVSEAEINLEQDMKNFLRQAEFDHGLLSALPKADPRSDGSTETPFTFTFVICRRKPIVRSAVYCHDGICEII
jgi:hypothetical protein